MNRSVEANLKEDPNAVQDAFYDRKASHKGLALLSERVSERGKKPPESFYVEEIDEGVQIMIRCCVE